MSQIDEICQQILEEVKPTPEEIESLQQVSEDLVKRIDNAASELGINAHGLLVGSAARGTWISGQQDIDVFIMLPPTMSRDELEEHGLKIARNVAEVFEERYAEHPYIRARFNGYDVDLVPCFNVENPSEAKSAVDRTPFHNQYMKDKIHGHKDQVLLLKQFMKAIDVYGAELQTQGFSGYLCEILVLHYGSFTQVLESASDWKHHEIIDLENIGGEYDVEPDPAPLIVIDPVDKKRNVAAALSVDNFSRFIDAAREFMEEPDIGFFHPQEWGPLSKQEFIELIQKRGTQMIAISFNAPDVVEDILYPQLYKAEKSIMSLVERNGFKVLRSGVWSDGKLAIILLEMETAALPHTKKHMGPPVTAREHAERFKQKYLDTRPRYIEEDRHYVEIPREHTTARSLLEAELGTCALGKNVSESIEKGYEILVDEEIVLHPGFDGFLGEYFNKTR